MFRLLEKKYKSILIAVVNKPDGIPSESVNKHFVVAVNPWIQFSSEAEFVFSVSKTTSFECL